MTGAWNANSTGKRASSPACHGKISVQTGVNVPAPQPVREGPDGCAPTSADHTNESRKPSVDLQGTRRRVTHSAGDLVCPCTATSGDIGASTIQAPAMTESGASPSGDVCHIERGSIPALPGTPGASDGTMKNVLAFSGVSASWRSALMGPLTPTGQNAPQRCAELRVCRCQRAMRRQASRSPQRTSNVGPRQNATDRNGRRPGSRMHACTREPRHSSPSLLPQSGKCARSPRTHHHACAQLRWTQYLFVAHYQTFQHSICVQSA
jgi:hypothetical protein